MHAPHLRRGLSLLELIVVIAIVALMISIALPAIHRVRESGNRAQCQNHLRQIGLAIHGHLNDTMVFPSNGGWDGQQQILDANGLPFVPRTFNKEDGVEYRWGVGRSRLSPREQGGSWAFAILPYLEQNAAHGGDVRDAAIPVYACPSRARRTVRVPPLEDKYGMYRAGSLTWAGTDYAANHYAVPPRPTCLSPNHVLDGLSHTILVGEKAQDPQLRLTGSWFWDEPYILGGSHGTSRMGARLIRDRRESRFRHNWGASHIDGVPFVFMDGSVRMFSFGTEPEILLKHLRIADGL